jgi:ornithine carbamoyltransferase
LKTIHSSVSDVKNLQEIIKKALQIKENPLSETEKGKGKTIGLVFLNSSLRTRLSSQIAAQNLGLNVLTLNAAQEAWNLEFADGAVMNGDTVEHIKDAIEVLNQYCDIIAVRCFAGMKSKEDDVNESILSQFEQHAKVPVISWNLQHVILCKVWQIASRLQKTGKKRTKTESGFNLGASHQTDCSCCRKLFRRMDAGNGC